MRKSMLAAFAAIAMTATSAHAAKQAELSPMQLQAIQQREYETDKTTLFSSVVSVFQDLGYTLNSADVNTGFITAESATVNKTSFWDAMGYATGQGNTRATAFIEPMASGRSRVRLNFISTKTQSSLYGQTRRQDKPILEPKVYQTAFEKVDEAVFVRKALDKPTPTASAAAPAPAPQSAAIPPRAPPPAGAVAQ